MENSWESAAAINKDFPDFHLEDKVKLLGWGIVGSVVEFMLGEINKDVVIISCCCTRPNRDYYICSL